MFCGMATTPVKPGREEDLIAAARDHAEALRAQPGCLATYVLLERGAARQVSISVFESEEAFQRAVEATRPVIAKHRIDQMWASPSSFAFFDVR